MSMLGGAVDTEEAYRIGLVNRVVLDEMLIEETASFAKRLAAMPTRALGSMKQALYASFESDLETALEREAVGQALCGRTADHDEGVAAFFEKREPNFIGAENGKTFFWHNSGREDTRRGRGRPAGHSGDLQLHGPEPHGDRRSRGSLRREPPRLVP